MTTSETPRPRYPFPDSTRFGITSLSLDTHTTLGHQANMPSPLLPPTCGACCGGGGGKSNLVFSAIILWNPIPTPSITASNTAHPIAEFLAARTPPRTAREPPVRKPAITVHSQRHPRISDFFLVCFPSSHPASASPSHKIPLR